MVTADPAGEQSAEPAGSGRFTVRLTNFEGPFDLLLQLIGKHKLDVTEVALHRVTDDFIAHIRAMGKEWDLDEASEFLVIAATLLDLKAARLLPAAQVENEEDLALLEARDLLFARLLQYRAFKQAAAFIADLETTGGRRWPRSVALEERYAQALPDLIVGIGVDRLAKLALKAFTPKAAPPLVSVAHIHQVRVSVREHAEMLRNRLFELGSATFSLLTEDCENTLEVVARFLALLELYREGLVGFDQELALGELTVHWTGGETAAGDLAVDDYDGDDEAKQALAAEVPDSAAPDGDLDDDDLDDDLDDDDDSDDEDPDDGDLADERDEDPAEPGTQQTADEAEISVGQPGKGGGADDDD
nr:segregation/condensation protein A [Catellatospora methionotrophica]